MCSIPELKPLELYIGTSEAQNAVVYPLDQLPHLLVCGMNGCGRSSFLRAQTALLAHGTPAEETPAQPLVPEIVETQPEDQRQVSTVQGCDDMEGHDFEHLCADALRANGYKQVQVTQASGDYGIDVLAQNNGVSYAIQCKRYNSPVGNHAVQEAYAGAAYYGSSVPVVLTNQDFTPAAREMAASLGVKLWGRSELDDLLCVYESTEQRKKRMILKVLKVVLKIALYAIGAAAVALVVVAAGIAVISAYAMVFAVILMFAPILVFFRPKKRRRRRR